MADVEGDRHEEPAGPDLEGHSWVLRRETEVRRDEAASPDRTREDRSREPSLGEAELERLVDAARRDPEGHPDWEAACLTGVADLLENLSRARAGWQSLDARLAESSAELERVRERLSTVERALAEARERRAATERERDEARAEAGKATAAAEELRTLRAELQQTQTKLRDAQHAATDYRAAVDRAESLQGELDELRWQLTESGRERDELMGERDTVARERRALKKERDELARRLEEVARRESEARERLEGREEAAGKADVLKEECEKLHRQHEQDLVAICDLRVALNRAERERDDALDGRKRKVKKILTKAHQVLDEVGAPAGEELSYGERIRRLARALGSAAAPRDPDPPPRTDPDVVAPGADETLDDPFDFGADEIRLE